MRDRRRRPYEILERQSTRIGPIRLDPCVDQQRNRFRRLMLKLTDHQRAATGGAAPVHVAQAVTVAELAHARDLQPRAVRPGNRRGIWSGASRNPELLEHCVPGKHREGTRRPHTPAEDKQSRQTGRVRFNRLCGEDTTTQRNGLIGLRGRGAGVTDGEASRSQSTTCPASSGSWFETVETEKTGETG